MSEIEICTKTYSGIVEGRSSNSDRTIHVDGVPTYIKDDSKIVVGITRGYASEGFQDSTRIGWKKRTGDITWLARAKGSKVEGVAPSANRYLRIAASLVNQ